MRGLKEDFEFEYGDPMAVYALLKGKKPDLNLNVIKLEANPVRARA